MNCIHGKPGKQKANTKALLYPCNLKLAAFQCDLAANLTTATKKRRKKHEWMPD
jgi:hypothetical protein